MPDYSKRMNEFVWYHIHGDGDCNGQVLKAYSEMNGLSEQDRFDLAYFYSITYCCTSAIFIFQNKDRIMKYYGPFADSYKRRLVFQSDRWRIVWHDNFKGTLATWVFQLYDCAEKFRETFIRDGILNTKKALNWVEKLYFFARFSAYLFIETYCDVIGVEASRVEGMEWEGDNMTFAGGLFYCFGMDKEAEYVQKNHSLPTDKGTFESLLMELQRNVKDAGGDDNVTKLETSLCAYEKFFKGTRYNGYYADRQLSEVVKMRGDSDFEKACNDVLVARKLAIPKAYRGEDNGWLEIRKDKKKDYQRTGKIMFCPY